MYFNSNIARVATLFSVVAISSLTGCASIVSGTNQVVSVETHTKDQQITGATCKLDNGKGTYYVTTPGTVTVRRAYDDMTVKCEKESAEPGLAFVKSTTKPMALGNLVFGGVVGAAVDASSGAAYDYPDLISIIMGESISLPVNSGTNSSEAVNAIPAPPLSSGNAPVAKN